MPPLAELEKEQYHDMKRLIETAALSAVLIIAGAALQGCNTLRSVGTDIKKGGQAIEDSDNNIQSQNVQRHTISERFAVNSNG